MSTDEDNHAPTAVTEIVVNLDDVTGEIVGEARQALLEAGALDVWATAIQMKKGRPGVMLSLLCEAEKREAFAKQLIELTGSFGVRYREWGRLVLERRHETVETAYGQVRIKVGTLDGKVVVAQPEFEDVKTLAQVSGATAREVMDAAKSAAQGWLKDQGAPG